MNLQSFRSGCVAALFVCTLATAEERVPLYRQATTPIPDRVRDLLSRMTVEEKVAQLQGLSNIPVGPGAVNLLKADKLDPEVAKRALGLGLGTFSYTDAPGAPGTPAQTAAKRNAIAGVLFGDVNPSGRLPVTIARNAGQLPVYYYKTPAARLGYVFGPNTPLYPFGFGLSYTNFAYGKPTLDRAQITPRGVAKVSVVVSNTGERAGDEVVQMYIHHPVSSLVQPVLALRDFKRIHLEPGQSEAVTFQVGPEQIAILDRHMQRIVEPGPVEVLIGPNSSQVTGVQFTVER